MVVVGRTEHPRVVTAPILVCTVGFDKPLRLARAVFGHPNFVGPLAGRQLKPAAYILLEALSQACNSILRDYSLEMAVLVVGANSGVGVCALAAILLVMDCFMMANFSNVCVGSHG